MPYSYLRDPSTNAAYFRHVATYTYDWESWHDPHGKLVWVNPSVERLTGYSVKDCMAMDEYPLPMVVAEDRPKIRQMLADAIAKTSFNDLEFRITTKAEETKWMAVSWQPMYDDQQKHHGFRTSVRDITERQGLKEQLRLYTEHLEQLVDQRTERIEQLEQHRRQMEKLAAMGELAAGVAHEINNPLAGIRNAFTLIKGSLHPSDEHYGLLELVDAEIERISSIVHQMYQLYKRNPMRPSELEVVTTVRAVLCLLDPIARRYRVELQVQAPQTPVCAKLPEGEFKQVLFNLIRNAIQASAPGQTVTVGIFNSDQLRPEPRWGPYVASSQWPAQRLVIQVIDSGTGIAEDVLPHIFEPFFTTKGQLREGMGLGLSVSRNLIESLGGTIDVRTEVGAGSTFTVTLPTLLSEPIS